MIEPLLVYKGKQDIGGVRRDLQRLLGQHITVGFEAEGWKEAYTSGILHVQGGKYFLLDIDNGGVIRDIDLKIARNLSADGDGMTVWGEAKVLQTYPGGSKFQKGDLRAVVTDTRTGCQATEYFSSWGQSHHPLVVEHQRENGGRLFSAITGGFIWEESNNSYSLVQNTGGYIHRNAIEVRREIHELKTFDPRTRRPTKDKWDHVLVFDAVLPKREPFDDGDGIDDPEVLELIEQRQERAFAEITA